MIWLVRMPDADDADRTACVMTRPGRGAPVLRIGLIPERDIFKQLKR
ncbi:hypothetical protein LCGC14_2553730, partial [marine sediment metagenome]